MKLTDLVVNQELIIQLLWGEQKIEFVSYVLGHEGSALFVTPYLHNGSALELNVTRDKGVVCNLFADNLTNKQRVSWKNIELTTVKRNKEITYCIKTFGFNIVAAPDDRRLNDRILVDVEGQAIDEDSGDVLDVLVHDISDVGVSFYAPDSFEPQSQQLVVKFTDYINEKEFNVSVEGTISRIANNGEKTIVGCRITDRNKDYQIYSFMRKLMEKNHRYLKSRTENAENAENAGTAEATETDKEQP